MTTSEVLIVGSVERTRAPVRFSPRTRSRTGLIVWPAHHHGGSTLVIDGAMAAKTAELQAKTQTSIPSIWTTIDRTLVISSQSRAKVFPLELGWAMENMHPPLLFRPPHSTAA